ncbi:MAG: acetyl-CoA carboxylase, carboxyltransferase subunit beta [Acidobacteriota bacterium]
MAWFKRKNEKTAPLLTDERHVKTEGVFVKCEGCSQFLLKREFDDNLCVCPKCNYHHRLPAQDRLRLTFDDEQWVEYDTRIVSNDPLKFVDKKPYTERLQAGQKLTGSLDALITGEGKVGGYPAIICSMVLDFVGGSVGSVVGEKIARAIEKALEKKSALIIYSASGGMRMQEGAISLMQMAKISAGLAKVDEAGLPFISILTDPTTGGTTASFAMLGDFNIAEPAAQIGFAGPRVIEQTIRQKLPPGFQRSEFLLDHGMLDAVVERKDLRDFLIRSFDFMFAK